jgi:hypothetical protein
MKIFISPEAQVFNASIHFSSWVWHEMRLILEIWLLLILVEDDQMLDHVALMGLSYTGNRLAVGPNRNREVW